MIKKIIILFLLTTAGVHPEGLLLFKPLVANPYEPRDGAFYEFQDNKLRLDIGASFDFIKLKIDSSDAAIGADFFTFTRLRHQGNFKFPVETTDFFFGLNYTMKFHNTQSYIRFRLAHISSHLVDGYTDESQNCIDVPIVYSREFIDVVYAQYISGFRFYGGLNFLFSQIPDDPNPITPQIGFDYSRKISDWLYYVMGVDFKLIGIDNVWEGTTSAQIGFDFKTSEYYGIFVGAFIYCGRSMHGQFYDEYDKYLGIGFQFTFF